MCNSLLQIDKTLLRVSMRRHIKDWQERDDPWRVHARWFPRCVYVISIQGIAFILENVEVVRILKNYVCTV